MAEQADEQVPQDLCQTDYTLDALDVFESFWDDNQKKESEETAECHLPMLDANGEILDMAGWHALITQVNLDPENTSAFQSGPPSVSSTVSTSGDVAGFSEHELRTLSVKDLNRALKNKGLAPEEVQSVKQRRRTIKNRGYAQDCRKKRIKVNESLETTNKNLFVELARDRGELNKVQGERDLYKSRWEALKKQIEQLGLDSFFSLGAE